MDNDKGDRAEWGCGGCRFTCAAQDCAHRIRCVEAGGDYVRDVSFPVGSAERAESWKAPECPVTAVWMLPESFLAPKVVKTHNETCADGFTFDGEASFNEADCGGVFDGFSVSSDADPGL